MTSSDWLFIGVVLNAKSQAHFRVAKMAAAPSDEASLQSHISKFSNIAGTAGYVFCLVNTAKRFGLMTPRRLLGVTLTSARRLRRLKSEMSPVKKLCTWLRQTSLISAVTWFDIQVRGCRRSATTSVIPVPNVNRTRELPEERPSSPQPHRRASVGCHEVSNFTQLSWSKPNHTPCCLLQIKPPTPWTRTRTGAASRRSARSSTITRMGEMLMDHFMSRRKAILICTLFILFYWMG